MSLDFRKSPPQKSDGFIIEQMDGEIVFLHPSKNIIVHANETAALVWQLCDGINTIDQIIEILSEAYPESRVQIAQDTPAAIQTLRAQGLLEGD